MDFGQRYRIVSGFGLAEGAGERAKVTEFEGGFVLVGQQFDGLEHGVDMGAGFGQGQGRVQDLDGVS